MIPCPQIHCSALLSSRADAKYGQVMNSTLANLAAQLDGATAEKLAWEQRQGEWSEQRQALLAEIDQSKAAAAAAEERCANQNAELSNLHKEHQATLQQLVASERAQNAVGTRPLVRTSHCCGRVPHACARNAPVPH